MFHINATLILFIHAYLFINTSKRDFWLGGVGDCVWSTVLWSFVALKTIIVSIGLALGAKINFTIDDKIQLFCSLYKRITSSPFDETRTTLVSQIAFLRVHVKYLDINLSECSNNKHS